MSRNSPNASGAVGDVVAAAPMVSSRRRSRLIAPIAPMIALTGFPLLRRWMQCWGATPEERIRPLPGDQIVSCPTYATTRAVTVHAPAERIWPWLVQMGYQRGGLYSYDWLDRLLGYLDRPSANQILPEFQQLRPGDVIPLGSGPDWPVLAVEPNHALVLNPCSGDFNVTWAFVLNPGEVETTRLLSRVRASFRPNPLTAVLVPLVLEPAALLMERRMLLGIKERAERLLDVSGNRSRT